MRSLSTLLVGLLLAAGTCTGQPETAAHTEQLRHDMVRSQIEARDVSDEAVLRAMRTVPRHEFAPDHRPGLAYTDRPLPIGHGQTISQPYIVAFMTEAVQPDSTDRVLEIGTGSGYQAAVLAEIVDTVYTIEIVPDLAKTARKRLTRLGYDNVVVRQGDGYQGWPEHAPFDVIVVTAAPDEVPGPLREQLAEGGRMIIPVGPQGRTQELTLIQKRNGELHTERLMAVRFVPFQRND